MSTPVTYDDILKHDESAEADKTAAKNATEKAAPVDGKAEVKVEVKTQEKTKAEGKFEAKVEVSPPPVVKEEVDAKTKVAVKVKAWQGKKKKEDSSSECCDSSSSNKGGGVKKRDYRSSSADSRRPRGRDKKRHEKDRCENERRSRDRDRERDRERERERERERSRERRRDRSRRRQEKRSRERDHDPAPPVPPRYDPAPRYDQSRALAIIPQVAALRQSFFSPGPVVQARRPEYPWPDGINQFSLHKVRNALDLVQTIMPLLILHRGAGLGVAMQDMVENHFSKMHEVLCTGVEVYADWEVAEVAGLQKLAMARFMECEPFWMQVLQQKGHVGVMPTEQNPTLKGFSDMLAALADKEIKSFVKVVGRIVVVMRLLSIFPEGLTTAKAVDHGTVQYKLWPDHLVDLLFQKSDWPWMARHLPIDCAKLTDYAKDSEVSKRVERHAAMVIEKKWTY